MTPTSLKIALFVLLIGVLTSCESVFNTVKGEGPVVSKEISLADFHEIQASAGWEVELIPDPQPGMVIHTEENLMDMVDYKIENGKLYITNQGSVGNSKSRIIQVFFKQLDYISADSNAQIFSTAIFEQNYLSIETSTNGEVSLKAWTDYCKAKTSSSGVLNLEGTTEDFKAKASTSSRINAEEFRTKNTTAIANTSGQINVYVSENLNAETETNGKVNYFGDPGSKNIKYNDSDKGIRSNDRVRSEEKSNFKSAEDYKYRGNRSGSRK